LNKVTISHQKMSIFTQSFFLEIFIFFCFWNFEFLLKFWIFLSFEFFEILNFLKFCIFEILNFLLKFLFKKKKLQMKFWFLFWNFSFFLLKFWIFVLKFWIFRQFGRQFDQFIEALLYPAISFDLDPKLKLEISKVLEFTLPV